MCGFEDFIKKSCCRGHFRARIADIKYCHVAGVLSIVDKNVTGDFVVVKEKH